MAFQINLISKNEMNNLIMNSRWEYNSLCLGIPLQYAKKLVKLSWRDVLFGIDNGFFTYQDAVQYAISDIDNNEKAFGIASISEKAILEEEEEVHKKIKEMVDGEESIFDKDKFIYIVLGWVYENRGCFEDILGAVEIIYDDFKFPEEIRRIIRYMPVKTETLLYAQQKGENYNYQKWSEYLEAKKKKYSMEVL